MAASFFFVYCGLGDALLCEKHSPKSAWLFYGEEAEEKFVGHSFVPVFNAPEGKEEDGFWRCRSTILNNQIFL